MRHDSFGKFPGLVGRECRLRQQGPSFCRSAKIVLGCSFETAGRRQSSQSYAYNTQRGLRASRLTGLFLIKISQGASAPIILVVHAQGQGPVVRLHLDYVFFMLYFLICDRMIDITGYLLAYYYVNRPSQYHPLRLPETPRSNLLSTSPIRFNKSESAFKYTLLLD